MNHKLPIFIATVLAASSATVLAADPAGTPAPGSGTPDRSVGRAIDDATITAAVKSKLLADRSTQGLRINVTTQNGQVTLSGQVRTATEKEAAEQMAANTTGVKSVQNQLTVKAES